MLLHLMYKALVELSATRADFLSRLFSRPLPPAGTRLSTTRDLVDWYGRAVPDASLLKRSVEDVVGRLVRRHGFALSPDDTAALERIQRAFYEAGPELRYSFPHRWFPSFADLLLETDDRGDAHGYLASDESFRRLQQLQASNLIVPIVGDFAGRKAIRAIGRYAKAHGATVNAFYTSNVEFYLFEHGGWRDFASNVAALPLDRNSLFIRAYFDTGSSQGSRSTTELDPIVSVLAAHNAGHIQSYADVIHRSERAPAH
jgi:hypothetical protein